MYGRVDECLDRQACTHLWLYNEVTDGQYPGFTSAWKGL